MILLCVIFTLFFTTNHVYSTERRNVSQINSYLNYDNNACYNYNDYPYYAVSSNCFISPNVLKDTPTLIRENGYNFDKHDVTTTDGYTNTIFRVYKSKTPSKGQPVYIQHGLSTDSSCFVQNGRENSLAFVLVENGYDVWLGNVRASQYGERHVKYTVKNNEFWNFTLDEIAAYDLRNGLQLVGKVTGKAGEILYIGHSMGTTLSFMYAIEYPSDNLIKGIYSLSPAAYIGTAPGVDKFWAQISKLAHFIQSMGVQALFVDNAATHLTIFRLCRNFPNFCISFINTVLGESPVFRPEHLTAYFSYFPTTTSINQLLQFSMFGTTNKFQKFDYGAEENLRRYNQKTPPIYDPKKITLPVFLFYGEHDAQIAPKGVNELFEALGSKTKEVNVVPLGENGNKYPFGHIQYIVGDNLTSLFFNDLVKFLKRLE